MQPTPVSLPGKSHGQRILVGYSSWVCGKESDTTEHGHTPTLHTHLTTVSLTLLEHKCSLEYLLKFRCWHPGDSLSSPSDLVIVIQEVSRTTLGETLPSSSLPFVSHLSTTVWNLIDHPLITNSVLFPFNCFIPYNQPLQIGQTHSPKYFIQQCSKVGRILTDGFLTMQNPSSKAGGKSLPQEELTWVPKWRGRAMPLGDSSARMQLDQARQSI